MFKAPLKLVLASAVLLVCPIANAQPGAYTDPNGNTAPSSGPGPGSGFPSGGYGGGRFQGGWNGGRQHHHSPVPNREQVMALPTLSQQQRQDIDAIYRQERQNIQPVIMQLRQMGGTGSNAPQGGAPGSIDSTASGAAQNPQRAELMHQVHETRRSTWEAVKAKLSPDQISQLEQQAANQPRQFAPND